MAPVRFDELKAAIRDYGQAAFQNLFKCRALADAVVAGFHILEGCPAENVAGVPADGPFEPYRDYGDSAFSYATREVIVLEPVRFGLCLIVGNAEDKRRALAAHHDRRRSRGRSVRDLCRRAASHSGSVRFRKQARPCFSGCARGVSGDVHAPNKRIS